jgi:hypothetical protein
MRRDVGRIHAALIAAGRVRLLESTSDTTATVQSTAASNDVKRTVQRVRALLER